jgi:phospholipid/cholesterol/gamma-HCH transport system ATP-binding protein
MMQPPSETQADPGRGAADDTVLALDRVSLAFDDKVILQEVSFTLRRGHTKIILGASGSGKSTILKLIVGLLKPDSGAIFVNGQRVDTMSEAELMLVRAGIGLVFQEGALFDSLTVAENTGYKLSDEMHWPDHKVRARVEETLGWVGLQEFADRMPSELSGGQRRRVAIARAMAARPGILLYDEATTGLDPITALSIDEEILKLRDLEEVTSVIVTHQLRDAFFTATHAAVRRNGRIDIVEADPAKRDEAEFVMLKDGRVLFEGNAAETQAARDPYIRSFLS